MHDYKLTHMIKLFMITLLFCLPQHFSLIKSLIFSNFGNYSFVCNYCTVCGLRINYHFFERYLVVHSKNQKIMALLPFIFCWRKYIFLMIIQIFIKKFFPLIFFFFDSLGMVDPACFSFWRDLHTDNLLVAQYVYEKHQMGLNGVEWYYMTHFSWNWSKTINVSKNITWKLIKRNMKTTT